MCFTVVDIDLQQHGKRRSSTYEMPAMISGIHRTNEPDGRRRNEMSYIETDDCKGEMPLSISNKCVDTVGWHRSEMLYVRRRLRLQPIHEGLREKLDSMGRIMPFLRLHLLALVLIFCLAAFWPWNFSFFFSRPLTPRG